MPRNSAISFVSVEWALPENTFRSPKPVGVKPSPLSARLISLLGRWVAGLRSSMEAGWGGRIRTFEYGIQRPAPYRLATPHHGHRQTPSIGRRLTGWRKRLV